MSYSCAPVFPDRNLASLTLNDRYGGYAGTVADTSKGRTNAALYYEDNCKAYAEKWMQDLAPCGYDSIAYSIIIPRLIQVCKEGADFSHPFGASTVKPGSTYEFSSFEDVIKAYNDSAFTGKNGIGCNADMISRPQRYDQPGMIVNLPVISVPDSCTCSKINGLYSQYVADSTLYSSFSNYLNVVHGSTISQGALDTLRNMCNGDTACRYLKNPILLPPALQCNGGSTCADCNTIRTLYDSFTHKYSVVPVLDDDDSVRLINTVFANFMNQRLGFSKQAWEYLDFMESCPEEVTSSCDSTYWIVFNPGTNFAINADLYANAVNNMPPYSQFFSGGYFNSPTTEQASHYVLVNKQDSIAGSTNTLIMQWRVKPGSDSKMADLFIKRGAYVTYVGASWIKDPEDTTWWIGSTTLPGTDGNMLKGMGLTSNSHGLKANWVKIINPATSQLLYRHDFTSPGNCTPNGPFLCGQLPADSAIELKMSECIDSSLFATQNATQLYNLFRQKIKGNFERAYSRKCMDAGKLESFTVTHPLAEYHYTLYYYDQAGNLVKTIPPEGVWVARRTTWLDSVKTARINNDVLPAKHNDSLSTTYRYNSLNQVISQHSPDGGLSKFWYDRLGRLAVSQNAKQQIDTYSYTLYDTLGRITQVGQKKQPTQMTDAISRSQSSLSSWLGYTYAFEGGGTVIAEQVTTTLYDLRDDEIGAMPPGFIVNTAFQKSYTLRNRVSSTKFYDKLPILGGNIGYGLYNSSSIYSYDIHGNVDTLLHDYQSGLMNQPSVNLDRFKVIAYQYDLISGKVNQVHYQPGMTDQLYHRYEYDAESRLTDVYITDRKELIGIPVMEEHDARYTYYKHGPLARTVLGQQMIQGIDYAYTLQGWLKGVNSDTLTDEDATASAIDAYRFSLNYFNGDYNAIGSSVRSIVFAGHSSHLPTANDYRPLFNGNISSMVVGIPRLGETRLYNYGYDQLNRLTKMDAYTGYNTGTHSWGTLNDHGGEYKERISYDGDGNILTYLRNGHRGELNMDNLTYHYNRDGAGNLKNNKLARVEDDDAYTNHYADNIGDHSVDIDNQPTGNYDYDTIGNLIKDSAEHIRQITWTVYGKIKAITKTDGTKINYTYDPGANRISKSVISGTDTTTTWYVRDAQGNPMGIYSGHYGTLTLNEQHLYGSSRLGIWNRSLNMLAAEDANNGTFVRGYKFFELSNHLGNVLVTISDRKFGHDGGGGVIDFYTPDVVNANDYYPFGMLQPGRKFSAGGLYRYGFNGKENDNDVKGEGNQQDYGMRIYDPRVGRFLSVDPITKNYPELTPYQFGSNRPIDGVDQDGLEWRGPAIPETENENESNPRTGRGGGPFSRSVFYREFDPAAAARQREEREFRREQWRQFRMTVDPEYRAEELEKDAFFNGLKQSIQKESYLQSIWNSARLVFGNGGTISQNSNNGQMWDDLVYKAMQSNPTYIGVARQVSFKVTGTVNGQALSANIRVDNVGVKINPLTQKPVLDFAEAKFSINEINVNNVKQTLTPQQLEAARILINGTNVDILIRGKGSAAKLSDIMGGRMVVSNKESVHGMIGEIKIVIPSSPPASGTKPTTSTFSSNQTQNNSAGTTTNQQHH